MKPWAKKLAVVACAGLVALVLAEAFLRVALFSRLKAFEGWRKPGYYANSFDEEVYWKLEYIFGSEFTRPEIPHPLLGWTGWFSGETYEHKDSMQVDGRRPVLLYGDSFAQCVSHVDCFEDILNVDQDFERDHYLLNYGVGGYGVGQILLLLQNSLDLYEDPFVVLSIMTEDMDRSILGVRSAPKPRFHLEEGQLMLEPAPPVERVADYYEANPPRVASYLYRWILQTHVLPNRITKRLKARRANAALQEKKPLNERLIHALIDEVESRDLDYVFLVFHSEGNLRATDQGRPDWRDPLIRDILEARGTPYIWSRDLIGPREPHGFSRYILPANGHPTAYFNGLIAEQIHAAVKESEQHLRDSFLGFEGLEASRIVRKRGAPALTGLRGRFEDATVRPLRVGLTFESSDPQVVRITDDGLAVAWRRGSAAVTVSYADQQARVLVRTEWDSVQAYGEGLIGSGDLVPELSMDDAASTDDAVAVRVHRVRGGADGVLVVSGKPFDARGWLQPMRQASMRPFSIPIRADGAPGQPGEGSVLMLVPAPELADLPGPAYVMAFFQDDGAEDGWSASNGLVLAP